MGKGSSSSATETTQHQGDFRDNQGGVNALSSSFEGVTVEQTDHGTVELAGDLIQDSIKSSEKILSEFGRNANEALEEVLFFAEGESDGARDLLDDVLSDALTTVERVNIGKDDVIRDSFDTVERINTGKDDVVRDSLNTVERINQGKDHLIEDFAANAFQEINAGVGRAFDFANEISDSKDFLVENIFDSSVDLVMGENEASRILVENVFKEAGDIVTKSSEDLSDGLNTFADKLERNKESELKTFFAQAKPILIAAAAAYGVPKVIGALKS